MIRQFFCPVLVLTALGGCGPNYSPDTYASNAVQQANKVEQGVVVGVRNVGVSASGTTGTITGAAAGGIAGSQAPVGPMGALTALGGSLVGGIAGATVEHATADTAAFEYIVRKQAGDLVSVTQKDKTPLALGQKVLVIAGNQARVVPDYTLPPDVSPNKSADTAKVETTGAVVMPKAEAMPAPAETKPMEAKPAEIRPGDAKPADLAPNQAEDPATH